MPWQKPPENDEHDRSDGTDGEKHRDEKRGECLCRSRERTYAKEYDQQRRHGEDGGNGDTEGEGGHGVGFGFQPSLLWELRLAGGFGLGKY